MKIQHKIVGEQKLRRRLQTIRENMQGVVARPALEKLMYDRILARYFQEKDENLVKWAARQPSTKKGPQILIQKGNLVKAIDIFHDNPNGRIARATGAGFRIGVKSVKVIERSKNSSRTVDTAVYGRIHQQGLGIVKRSFLGVSSLDIKAVDSFVRRELRRVVELSA